MQEDHPYQVEMNWEQVLNFARILNITAREIAEESGEEITHIMKILSGRIGSPIKSRQRRIGRAIVVVFHKRCKSLYEIASIKIGFLP
jgi:hypothetical protein